MPAWLTSADDILRRAPWTTRTADNGLDLLRLAACLVIFGACYGMGMGAFRALVGESQWLRQMLYSALKVPVLLSVTFLISLPSFFVINTLVGLRNDFGQTVRALIATQAGLAIVLASLTPLTLLWYASSTVYQHALVVNGIMFAVASAAAQRLLRGYYEPLIARNERHRHLLGCWTGLYVFVAIQLAWLLRPFIGSPDLQVQFTRPEIWDNAYVVIARLIWQAFTP